MRHPGRRRLGTVALVVVLSALVAPRPAADAPDPGPPELVEGGYGGHICAGAHLFLCGPWWPVCPRLPSACYAQLPQFGF